MPSGNNPVPGPVLTKIPNAIWRHQAGPNELKITIILAQKSDGNL